MKIIREYQSNPYEDNEKFIKMIRIRDIYANKSVLITGASGFLGKVLVEKFLRDVKELKSIYFFLRPKRGHSFEERIAKIKNDEIFRSIRQRQPDLMDKLKPIQADLMLKQNFGVTDEDLRKLSEDVSFVIHAAATVRFDETLQDAIRLNTLATRDLIGISKTFKKLESFTYVSTAYSNSNRPSHSEVKEIIHDLYSIINL